MIYMVLPLRAGCDLRFKKDVISIPNASLLLANGRSIRLYHFRYKKWAIRLLAMHERDQWPLHGWLTGVIAQELAQVIATLLPSTFIC